MKTIRLDVDGRGVATLTLAREEKRNALSAGMIAELTEAAGQLADDDAIGLQPRQLLLLHHLQLLRRRLQSTPRLPQQLYKRPNRPQRSLQSKVSCSFSLPL